MNWLKGFLLFFVATVLLNFPAGAQQKNNNSTSASQKAPRRPLPKPLAGSRGFERFAGRDASARLVGAAATREVKGDAEVLRAIDFFEEGKEYFEAGKYEKAIKAFELARNKYPKPADVSLSLAFSYFNLGNAYADDSQYEKAVEAYKQVFTFQTNVPRVYYNMGVAYVELNRPDEAIRAFREAIRLRADHAMAYYNLGILYGTAGDFQAAADAFKQALALKRRGIEAQYSLDEAHFNLGLALFKLNRKAEAMEQYQALKELKSKLGDELLALIS
jgi:tetratricopeptide (TPR) repeat protein